MSRFGSRPTRFALVADDFAMTAGVSRSILELLALGRLNGTGVMANRPHWPVLAAALREHDGRADLGLHLNLTAGSPLGGRSPLRGAGAALPDFGALARAAFSGGLDRDALADEVLRQVDACADGLGRLPDYVDGHQHVHLLPGVRGAVLAAVARRWHADARPWLRDTLETPGTLIVRGGATGKAMVIAGLSLGWRQAARKAGCATNRGFAGISAFDPSADFAADFARFLVVPGQAHLVMCHPGHVDDELAALDPVVATRPREHAFLAGDGLPLVLSEARMEMVRMSSMAA